MSDPVLRPEYAALERRVRNLEEQRQKELEERSERSWRHTQWFMNAALILVVGAAVVLWTIQITLAVSGD